MRFSCRCLNIQLSTTSSTLENGPTHQHNMRATGTISVVKSSWRRHIRNCWPRPNLLIMFSKISNVLFVYFLHLWFLEMAIQRTQQQQPGYMKIDWFVYLTSEKIRSQTVNQKQTKYLNCIWTHYRLNTLQKQSMF